MARKQNRTADGRRRRRRGSFKYDVCLSFAGEDRSYVEKVSRELCDLGIRVFYDKHEEVALWGRDLYEHLDYVYRRAARFCVLFVSRHYASKAWANHERRSAQARALRENEEYILPARFDGTEVPGLRDTLGFVRLKNRSPKQFATLIAQKIGPRQRSDFLPPSPDRLYRKMGAHTKAQRDEVQAQLRSFYDSWARMTADERRVVTEVLLHCCPAELPKFFHINLDLLRRVTGFPIPKVEQAVGNLSSLGIFSRARSYTELGALTEQRMVELWFHAMSVSVQEPGPHNRLLDAVFDAATDKLCDACARDALMRADFSHLSSATIEAERHKRRRRAS